MIVRLRMKGLLQRLWRKLALKAEPAPEQPRLSEPSAAEPISISPKLSRSPRQERTLIVGVDFGTSSTKVAWQDLSDNHFEMFRWASREDAVGELLLPSTVVIRGDEMSFGLPEGSVREGDIRLRSIKLCVMCQSNPSICRCGNPFSGNGIVSSAILNMPCPASSFACVFLAYVFHEVESRLVYQFDNDDVLLLWNVGCPMDYLDEANRKDEWERIAGVAMNLHRKLENPASLSLLKEVGEALKGFVVPAEVDRNYFVKPEGLAAVKAFLESPHAESKTYAIVDVGAGTTEVSFFFNGRISAEPGMPLRPSYLADSTEPVGGGKMDLELARKWGISTEEARQRKEFDPRQVPEVPCVEEICAQYEKTCGRIIDQKKLSSRHDMRFDLFVIGGGGRPSIVPSALCYRRLPGGFVVQSIQRLKPPPTLKDRGGFEADYDLLANACGLASSLSWDYYPMKEVGSMPSALRSAKPRQHVDELYPK
jgi:hypothetical protein